MVTGYDIVRKARTHSGVGESPPGSNRGPFVQKCQAASWLSGTGFAWCACYVDEICEECGVPLTGANSAGAHDLANRHRVNWVTDKTKWRPGMVVDYNEGSGHTGILTDVSRVHEGVVTSIDGNWSDAVTEHEMSVSLIRAVWAIPGVTYDTHPAPAVKRKRLPAFQVVTSHSGSRKVLFVTRRKHKLTSWLMHHTLAKVAPNGIVIRRGRAR